MARVTRKTLPQNHNNPPTQYKNQLSQGRIGDVREVGSTCLRGYGARLCLLGCTKERLCSPAQWVSLLSFQLVHRPMLIDMNKVYRQTNLENLDQAFSVAERDLGVTRLLDPEGTIH